ncbi:hypothetical protein [Rhodococcus spongiicola]|uniref:Uncharacterized protein n=1 Tax=Rhodococcus spongiicola TaxID=2487352 RepID=A0A3S3B9C6_9NOCA|nr:hypothetical protein [Rhodococcus spongiicola]RVW06144.1 hypothetical protein EF834_01395 [Rhodococcus spongiicola]
MIRSIRRPLIVVAATVGVVAGGFGATQASAAPPEASIQAVSEPTPAADTGSLEALDGYPTLSPLGSVVVPPLLIGFSALVGSSMIYCVITQCYLMDEVGE